MRTDKILKQQWVEAKPISRQGPLVISSRGELVPYHTKQSPQTQQKLDEKMLVRLANRKLCDITGSLMSKVNYIDHMGRIILVGMVPIKKVDPIIAVPCVEMRGWRGWIHNLAYRELIDLLLMHENNWVDDYRKWYSMAKVDVKAIIKYSEKFMNQDEWNYYSQQMYETLANPQRKIGK